MTKVRVRAIHSGRLGHAAFATAMQDMFSNSEDISYSVDHIPASVVDRIANHFPRTGFVSELYLSTVAAYTARSGPTPDCWHVHPQSIAHLFVSDAPVVVSLDALGGRRNGLGISRLHYRVDQATLARATASVSWSAGVARSLAGADSLVKHIPPPVDTSRFARPNRPDGPARIIFVGNDFYRKGGDLLLTLYGRLKPGSAQLTIVSNDPRLSTVQKCSGVRVLAGLRPSDEILLEELCNADIFAFPTRYEAYGLALLEAMAAGLVVIAADIGVTSEIVGDAGILIPPGAGFMDSFSGALNQLICDEELRQVFGRRARARVVARHSFDVVRSQWTDLFLGVCRAQRR